MTAMPDLSEFLKSIDPKSSQPLYQQLQRALREAIERGALGPEDALPSERQLASELGISRITVRKAIDSLADEGLLVRRQGSGNFVGSMIEKNFAKLTSFSEDMRARGRVPSSRWLKRQVGQVTAEEAMRMGLSPGAKVYRFHRLRLADDEPMTIEYCTIAGFALPSEAAVNPSLYDALEANGTRPVRALQRLRALLLDEEQAQLLEAKPGDAGLLVERVGYLRDGRTVEISQSYYRGDTYDFVAELNTE
jgi:GntR family transcriptional regulator